MRSDWIPTVLILLIGFCITWTLFGPRSWVVYTALIALSGVGVIAGYTLGGIHER